MLSSIHKKLYNSLNNAIQNGGNVAGVLEGKNPKDILLVVSITDENNDTLLTYAIEKNYSAAIEIRNSISKEDLSNIIDTLAGKAISYILNNNGNAQLILNWALYHNYTYNGLPEFNQTIENDNFGNDNEFYLSIKSKLTTQFTNAVRSGNFDIADKFYEYGEKCRSNVFKNELLQGDLLYDVIDYITQDPNSQFLANTLEFASRNGILNEVLEAKISDKKKTLLEIAEEKGVKEKVEEIIQVAKANAAKYGNKPIITESSTTSQETNPVTDALPSTGSDNQNPPHNNSSESSYYNLSNDDQKALFRDLMNAIKEKNEVSSEKASEIFEGKTTEDIQAVLSTSFDNDHHRSLSFLMCALLCGQKNIAEAILNNADKSTRKKLLTQKSILEYEDLSLGNHTVLDFVIKHKFGNEFVNMIEQKTIEATQEPNFWNEHKGKIAFSVGGLCYLAIGIAIATAVGQPLIAFGVALAVVGAAMLSVSMLAMTERGNQKWNDASDKLNDWGNNVRDFFVDLFISQPEKDKRI